MVVHRFTPRLAGAVLLVAVVGSPGQTNEDRCTAAWQYAGERSLGYLTDRAATPYLAMMLATLYERLPIDYRVSNPDFIAACRAGAIWQIAPDVAN